MIPPVDLPERDRPGAAREPRRPLAATLLCLLLGAAVPLPRTVPAQEPASGPAAPAQESMPSATIQESLVGLWQLVPAASDDPDEAFREAAAQGRGRRNEADGAGDGGGQRQGDGGATRPAFIREVSRVATQLVIEAGDEPTLHDGRTLFVVSVEPRVTEDDEGWTHTAVAAPDALTVRSQIWEGRWIERRYRHDEDTDRLIVDVTVFARLLRDQFEFSLVYERAATQ